MMKVTDLKQLAIRLLAISNLNTRTQRNQSERTTVGRSEQSGEWLGVESTIVGGVVADSCSEGVGERRGERKGDLGDCN